MAKQKQKFKTLPAHEAIKLKEKLNKELERAREFLNEKFYNMLKAKGIKISKEEFLDLKPFHWGFEFYEAFDLEKPKEERGFDVIIGNPPYGDPKSHVVSGKELEILKSTFKHKLCLKNSASIFIERSYEKLRKNGKFGYIIPHTFSRKDYFSEARKFLLENSYLYLLADAGQPFIGVNYEMMILFFSKEKKNHDYTINIFSFRNKIKNKISRKICQITKIFPFYWNEIVKLSLIHI